jgi:hypothetical protein
MTTISTNVEELLAINDEHRNANATGDLISCHDIRPPELNAAVSTTCPLIVPVGEWRSKVHALPSLDECEQRLASAFPLVYALLTDIALRRNIVLAGGAAAMMLSGTEAGDADLFIHGIDPDDTDALWRKVDEVYRFIVEAAFAAGDAAGHDTVVRKIVTHGVFTLIITQTTQDGVVVTNSNKIQIIMRAYPSVSALLHGFDIPAACVAYDGVTVGVTTCGAFAHLHRLNIVNPAWRSTTYEHRLTKYFERGFGLVLAHARPVPWTPNAKVDLPYLSIQVVDARGLVGYGHIQPREATASQSPSDYKDRVHMYVLTQQEDHASIFANLKSLAAEAGPTSFVLCDTMFECPPPASRVWAPAEGAVPPTHLREIMPYDVFDDAVHRVSRGATEGTTSLDARFRSLTGLLGMSEKEALKVLTDSVKNMALNNRRLWHTSTLRGGIKRLTARWQECRVEWWITADPARQWTAARNPRMTNPAEWYNPRLSVV